MPSAFQHTGIFPYCAQVLSRKITEHDLKPTVDFPEEDLAKLVAIRDNLRANGVSEELIATTLQDILLEKKGLKQTDLFSEELS